jgi:hypothetical protein
MHMRRTIGTIGVFIGAISLYAAPIAIPVRGAQVVHAGAPVAPEIVQDAFGKGRDGLRLRGSRAKYDQLRWAAPQAGTFWLGLETWGVIPSEYLLDEFTTGSLKLYVNDTPVPWGGHTEPVRQPNGHYTGELRSRTAVTLSATDTVRVVYQTYRQWVVLGELHCYLDAPTGNAVTLPMPAVPPRQTTWLRTDWVEATDRDGVVRETLALYNPGVAPRSVRVSAMARDYEQRVLLTAEQTVEVPALKTVSLPFEFKASDTARDRLTVSLDGTEDCEPIRLSRFRVRDVRVGPRRRASLNGEWQLHQFRGPETGETPPADATWAETHVPQQLSNKAGHCAWLRKTFDTPAFLRGERYTLFFDHTLCEVRVVLNGKQVGFRRYGSEPFELDVTDALNLDGPNTLDVAVRDWIAYSPKNQERLAKGEKIIFKDHMTSPAGYTMRSYLGIRGPVWLATRPTIHIEDVDVVTRVKAGRLELRYRLRNSGARDASVKVVPQMLDAGEPALDLGEKTMTVPAGGSVDVAFSKRWRKPKLWWPGKPHLYVLETRLGDLPERHVQRFGFRDIRIKGTSFLMNGVPWKFRSKWAGGATGVSRRKDWEPAKRFESIWNWQARCMKRNATQVARAHNHVGVREVCEMADESGLVLKIENGHICQQKFSFSKTWWEAAIASERAMVDAYKNHASVLFWSAGNENMWGWAYQGEATRTMANRWQTRAAREMTEADPMKRPVEWEADGDLMGNWNFHALHYPLELARNPAMPNQAWWGPLDGKTVFKYSMGDVTLGEKPLTVGEAYWPANINRPWGCSIINGDRAFQGGAFWREGWGEATRFLTNGLRDAEFALIDTYSDQRAQIRPQAIVLKEEDSQFFGGRTVVRHLNVHHDLPEKAKLILEWHLGGTRLGRKWLRMEPAELRRITLKVKLPAVERVVEEPFVVSLLDGERSVATATRRWGIFPKPVLRSPANLQLTLFDPSGESAKILAALGVPFTLAARPTAPGTGALVIAPGALTDAGEGAWRASLAAFVKKGGRVLVLAQRQEPDFVPVKLTMSKRELTTIAFVRAGDHPALRGLRDNELRWWADGMDVSTHNFRKPTRGNWLPLVDVGTVDGPVETPLLELYDGEGSFVLCQMPIVRKARSAPQALRLLENLLAYLAAPAPFRTAGKTFVLAKEGSRLRGMLNDARLVTTDQRATASTVIVDAASLAAPDAVALRAFAQEGGTVFVHRGTPETKSVAELVGAALRFRPVEKEPREVQFMCLRRTDSGLLAGISNHEMYWSSGKHKQGLQHEGGWWSAYTVEPKERIADWIAETDAPNAVRLTRPGGLLEIPVGKGRMVISTLRLDEPVPALAVTVTRLRSLLLTNLGCELRGDGGAARARKERLKRYEFSCIDLAPYANRGFRDDAKTGLLGWTNQGENDMRNLPTGSRRFADIPFQLAAPKGAITLHSRNASNTDCPKKVAGIKIGRKADVLFFLHAVAWSAPVPFQYRIHYADGTETLFEVKTGQQVIDWWAEPTRYAEAMERHGLFVAWQGDNPMHKGVILPGCEWTNPHPGKKITTLDFETPEDSRYSAVPVLAAITAGVARPSRGTVVDIIGTRGVKVRLGTTVEDVYYIGAAGIPDNHPYRKRALAAHRAMVVGKAVSLSHDAVTRDADGHHLAYVYLGTNTYNVRDLVNAKLIGGGLAKLGAFGGNGRQRMYLENLGFIASQKKTGLWAEGK